MAETDVKMSTKLFSQLCKQADPTPEDNVVYEFTGATKTTESRKKEIRDT
jgi:hypothetical protein